MATEDECLEALQRAADRLGESPTKAQYEELGLRPASATILRTCGGWNDAKEMAGLETAYSRGSRVGPKPDDVDLPEGTSWEDLSVDQRWHYKNADWNTARSLDRRESHRTGRTNFSERVAAVLVVMRRIPSASTSIMSTKIGKRWLSGK